MSEKKEPIIIDLPEEFKINTISEQYQNFLRMIDKERPIIVDMEQVHSLDYTGLQMLYSLMRSCVEKDLDFSLANVHEPIRNTICLCGLAEELLREGTNGSI